MNWSVLNCQRSTHYLNYLEIYWPCAGGLSALNAHRYAIARPDILGTGPKAYGGVSKWTPPPRKPKESRGLTPESD